MATFSFYGVKIEDTKLMGTITSGELIDNFQKTWIPKYQRERKRSKKKIKELIQIYETHDHLDALRINLLGEYAREGRYYLLDGSLHFIDGQQRLLALIDSGVRDYKVPVELYVNLEYDEELRLYRQFNEKATKLTFAEQVKAYESPLSEHLRKVAIQKSRYPIQVSLNRRTGVTYFMFCALMFWIHRRMFVMQTFDTIPTTADLRTFMDKQYSSREAQQIEFAVRNMLDLFRQVFGEYDYKSDAYRQAFLLGWCHVMIDKFLDNSTGKYDLRGADKFKRRSLIDNSYIKQLARDSNRNIGHRRLYDEIVKFFNKGKRQKNRLEGIQSGEVPPERDNRLGF